MRKRHYIFLIVLTAFFLLFRFIGQMGINSPDEFFVIKVIDGDSFELEGRGKVRLLGIDTPEKGDLLYDSAKSFLSSLILNKQVTLKFGSRKRDGYGRLLAYTYRDSILINERILQAGLANVYLFPDNFQDRDLLERLLNAQRQAILDTLGIWANPYNPESHYIGNSKTYRFHRPDCKSVENIPDSRKIVYTDRVEPFFEGLSPCRNCKP
ncbi:MAG: thermonuclease family protein [candidate division Zixibacteria bacterium]